MDLEAWVDLSSDVVFSCLYAMIPMPSQIARTCEYQSAGPSRLNNLNLENKINTAVCKIFRNPCFGAHSFVRGKIINYILERSTKIENCQLETPSLKI